MTKGLGIVLEYEAADSITRANLLDYRETIIEMLQKHEENPDENFMHPEDFAHNTKMLKALEFVVGDFGGL